SPTRSGPSNISRCRPAAAICTRSSSITCRTRAICSSSRSTELRPESQRLPRQAGRRELLFGDLLRNLLAGSNLFPPERDAASGIHRALADDPQQQEICEQVDLVRLQRRRRVGQFQAPRANIGKLEAEAAPVTVGQTIEWRHAGSRPAALDGENE